MNPLDYCRRCVHRKPDFHQGLLCGLTNSKASFEDSCPDFKKDESLIGTSIPASETRLKSNDKRAKALLTLIWVVLIIEFLSLVSKGLQYNLLNAFRNGETITTIAANANDLRERIIAIAYLATYISSGIVFIFWFRRAYNNLHQKVNGLSHTEGYAAGGWFIPFANFYIPVQIMLDLYKRSKEYFSTHQISINNPLNTNNVILWWVLWITNGVFSQITYHAFKDASSIQQLINMTVFDAIEAILGIILAMVTIRVIKDYSSVEGKLNETGVFGIESETQKTEL